MTIRSRWPLSLALILVLACAHRPKPALSQALQAPPPGDPSLQQLVAPIALYPDALVAQILPASTQPIQIVEAARAVAGGQRPDQATASQWDPSVQALLSFPSVLKMMNDKINWTTKLGQAVVANQGAVMAAIQQVRQQAQAAGNLKSNPQQVVTTQGSTIIIEPANPQYIYVPQYNPVAILAPAPYYAYAPLMTFGVGFAAGAATAYACDWGHYGSYGSVTVNNNYHYSYENNYNTYHSTASGSYSTYHPQSGTYHGYNANTGTYGAYNPATGKYGTYNPSTGAYNKSGTTGTYHPPSETSEYHPSSTTSEYHPSSTSSEYHGGDSGGGWGGSRSSWGSGGGSGGDAFHGLGGGGWGAQDASNRGFESGGGRSFGGGGFGGGGFGGGGFGGGGFDRGGGFGGGGFGGFRGGGFGGRR